MSMKKSDFRCLDRMRVRWAEVDLQKIVFNAHYLMYFDTALAALWRGFAADYHPTMELMGGDLFVKKSSLEYFASAEYDDVIDVGLRCARIGNSSITLHGGIFRGQQLLVSGELIYVFADPHSKTSKPVPPGLRRLYEGFDAGETMVHQRLGNWQELGDLSTRLRHQVFAQEQGIAAELMCDAHDTAGVHAVFVNLLDEPIGCGRLVHEGAESGRIGRIGRMAVSRPLRSGGLGSQLLNSLVEASRQRGDQAVTLHAQLSAQVFYEKLGFVTHGPVFDEAGIQHIEMQKRF
jgi:YbgC/YbaW family acyl-CoA thioester hydrolase